MTNSPLDAIVTYGLNELEAKAFKATLLWHLLSRKEFPDYKHAKLKTGDPRKSLLFKYCYKLMVETKGLVPDNEYKLYITAQLQILKGCNDGRVHALIDPRCLVGEKAWRRWKLWKNQYDVVSVRQEGVTREDVALPDRVRSELSATKRFLSTLYPDMVMTDVPEMSLKKWVRLGKVSPYFVLLSPVVKNLLGNRNPADVFAFDVDLYGPAITPEIRDWFRHEFAPTPGTKAVGSG